jgi:hypothetical protein
MLAAARLKRYLIGQYKRMSGVNPAGPLTAGGLRPPILASYLRSSPSPQNALDIFKGEWASHVPGSSDRFESGRLPLFDDSRVTRFLSEIGGVSGKTVLELGPLEGGHSYMLDRAGAAQVIAIEGNSRAFLKCLIVKELLGLPRVQFLCGDFVAYLRETERQFDVCVACGVLYHLQNPAELVALLAGHCTGHLYIWTHYYDRALIATHSKTSHTFPGSRRHSHLGFEHTLYTHEYQRDLDNPTFCGGSASTSSWMTKEDILRCLAFFGFADTQILGDQPDHQNGPAFDVIARRTT